MAIGTDWSMVFAAALALLVGTITSLDLAVDLLDVSTADLPEVIGRFGRRMADDQSGHVWAWQMWARRALDCVFLAAVVLLFLRMELPGPYDDPGNRVIWATYAVAQAAWFVYLLRLPRHRRPNQPEP